ALAGAGLGHLRVVDGGGATQAADEGHALVQVGQQALAGVSAIADEGKAAAGEPLQQVGEQPPGQGGATGLGPARQVQAGQQGQGQDGGVAAGQADGHGQHDPVVAAGGGDSLAGAGDGVAEPAQAPDALAALVRQGVIDQQGADAPGRQACQHQPGDAVGQAAGGPGGALEEVVVAVVAVASG